MWRFDTPEGAEEALRDAERLAHAGLIDLHDAASLSWPPDATTLRTSVLHPRAGERALGDAFWGLLLGVVFYVPLIGAARGTATGLFSGTLTAVGIDDGFINSVRDRVAPGSSALFLLTTDEVVDTVQDALAERLPSDPVFTGLTDGQVAALREAFGAGDSPVAGEPTRA